MVKTALLGPTPLEAVEYFREEEGGAAVELDSEKTSDKRESKST